MPFRSGKFSLWGSSLVLFAALVGASAFATVTVVPSRSDSNTLNNLSSTTAYFPVSGGTGTLDSSLDVLTRTLDLSIGQTSTSVSVDDAMYFTISSDNTSMAPDAGQKLLLMVFASISGGTQPVPIGLINPTANTTSTLYYCVDPPSSGGNLQTNCQLLYNNFAYAYVYTPGQTVQVGIYPKDICTSTSGQATGCASSSGVTAPTAALNTQMNLTFKILKFPDTLQTGFTPTTDLSSASNADSNSPNLGIVFRADASSITCPTNPSTDRENLYFPGDEQIFLNTSAFGITNNGTPAVPISQVMVVGKQSTSTGSVADRSNFLSNDLVVRVDQSISEPVSGFVNSTPEESHYYGLGFNVRDAAGFVTNGAPASGDCTLTDVRTSSIRGFLAKNSCFVATAAFGGPDGRIVTMLREFRDGILIPSAPGRKFVRWYYSWSPPAADWIRERPIARGLVQIALWPLILFAWLTLHPACALVFALVGGLSAFVLARRRRGRGEPALS